MTNNIFNDNSKCKYDDDYHEIAIKDNKNANGRIKEMYLKVIQLIVI